MVYIASWQEYQEAAEALYAKSPKDARYCVKWKSSEGKLVLKITDNSTCLKFRTYSSIFLNRFEALNLSLMQKMQNRRPDAPAAQQSTSQKLESGDSAVNNAIASGSAAPGAGGPAGGGVKKKKPKKKKP